jgi:hypothetical protein
MPESTLQKNQRNSIHGDAELKEGDLVMGELNRMFDHIFNTEQNSGTDSIARGFSGSKLSGLVNDAGRDKLKLSGRSQR